MFTHLRLLVLFIAGAAIAMGVMLASPSAPAYAQSCDPGGSTDGTAVPAFVQQDTVVTFTATNFSANEEVSFWFTTPQGDVVGTAAPLCCASAEGRVDFAPTSLPPVFFQFPGKWALTVQGSQSQHTSIIFFCLGVQQQPTAPPATATTAPAPATATTAPAPATVEATVTAAATVAATAEATVTGVAASPTVESTVTVAATAAATAPAVATVEATATTAPPAATATVETLPLPTAEATPGVIGMPVTGAAGGNDTMLNIGLVLVALSMLALGLVTRRAEATRK